MNITDELDKIIYKYQLDKYYPHYRKMQEAKKILVELLEEINKEKQKAIFVGDDRDAMLLLRHMARKQEVEFFNSVEETTLEEIQWQCYDKVYVVSFQGVEHTLYWMRLHGIQYIWLYDIFEAEGISFERSFAIFGKDNLDDWFPANFIGKNRGDNLHLELFFEQRKYNFSRNAKVKQIALEKSLFLSLYMKNFVKAEEYFYLLGQKDKRFLLAQTEINDLLRKIREEVRRRSKEHIVIYWMDAVDYEQKKYMPYLESRMECSVSFENAFTHVDNTTPTAKAMFCKAKVVDDDSYKIKKITKENSVVLQLLEENNYDFKVISGYFSIFEQQILTDTKHPIQESSSSICWDLIQQLIIAEKKTVYLAHLLIEGHSPSLSTYMEEDGLNSLEMRKIWGCKELDEQLKYYDTFLGEKEYRIYMSDHGSRDFLESIHVHFNIFGTKLKAEKVKEMFSLLNFSEVLKQLIIQKTIISKELVCDFVEFQKIDYYNAKIIKQIIEEKQPLINYYFGCKGIITKEYIYLWFKTGKQWLIPRGKTINVQYCFTEYICDEKKLPMFQKLVGIYPKHFDKDELFSASKYLYQYFDKMVYYVKKKMDIICELLEEFSDKSVAMRMGGMHSYYLYILLPQKYKQKIVGFIDNNKECYCSCFELPIVSIHNLEEIEIEGVILSSFKHRKVLCDEAKRYPKTIKWIDIYEILEKNGFVSKKEFYFENEITDIERNECMDNICNA